MEITCAQLFFTKQNESKVRFTFPDNNHLFSYIKNKIVVLLWIAFIYKSINLISQFN